MQNGSEQHKKASGTFSPVQGHPNISFPEEKEEKFLPKNMSALDNPQNNGFL